MHSLTNSTNVTDVPRNVTWLWMISWRKKLHTVLYALELIWRRRLLHFIVFQGLRFDSSWGLFVPRSRQDDKNISPYLHWTQNLLSLLFHLQKMTLSTWQYAGCVSYELCNGPRSPQSLWGSVVEHRDADPKVWGSISYGDSEFFVPRS